MPKLSERGVVHLLVPIILLLGIIAGVYLLVSGNLNLFSKASNPPIVFKTTDGKPLSTDSAGIPQSSSGFVRIEFTSTLGGPVGGLSSPSSPVSSRTSSFRFAESPTGLDKTGFMSYTREPMFTNYSFSQPWSGLKSIWVEFKAVDGRTERRTAQIGISSTVFVCTACVADINKDGYVNGADISFLVPCMNKSATSNGTNGKPCIDKDINKDKVIDQNDLDCIKGQFSKQCTPTATPVPVPTGAITITPSSCLLKPGQAGCPVNVTYTYSNNVSGGVVLCLGTSAASAERSGSTYTYSKNGYPAGTYPFYLRTPAKVNNQWNCSAKPAGTQLDQKTLVVSPAPTPAPTPRGFGQAISLNGTSQFVQIPNSTFLNSSSNFTVETWIKPSIPSSKVVPGNQECGRVVSKSSGSVNAYDLTYCSFNTSDGKINYTLQFGVAAQQISCGAITLDSYNGSMGSNGIVVSPSEASNWRHVAGVVKDGNIYIFDNGKMIAKGFDGRLRNTCNNTNTLQFGARSFGPGLGQDGYFKGAIDEVRISNNARYNANFTVVQKPFTSDTNTVGLWHLDGNATDTSGKGGNGQAMGGAQFVTD